MKCNRYCRKRQAGARRTATQRSRANSSSRIFAQTLDFVTAVGELAESEFHHPVSINFGGGSCAIVLQTKKIKGLHENDFIMAAKINEIAADMGAGE